MNQARYYVYSKYSTTRKAMKNFTTREAARNYKRGQNDPSRYGIYDREAMSPIR